MAVDCVVGHHMNPFRSGVARFNEILAERLGVALVGLEQPERVGDQPLYSFKAGELDETAVATVEELIERGGEWSLFLHDFSDLPVERKLIAGARRVWLGNHELL